MSDTANVLNLGPAVVRVDGGRGGKKGAKPDGGFAALVKPATHEAVKDGAEGRGALIHARTGWVRDMPPIGIAAAKAPRNDDDAIGHVDLGLEFAIPAEDARAAAVTDELEAEPEVAEETSVAVVVPFLLPAAGGLQVAARAAAGAAAADTPGQALLAETASGGATAVSSGDRPANGGNDVAPDALDEGKPAPAVADATGVVRVVASGTESRAGAAAAGNARPAVDPASSAPAARATSLEPTAQQAGDMLVAGAAASADRDGADSGDADRQGSGDRRGAPDAPPPKITVVSEQSLPAPAVVGATTSVALAASIAGDPGWQAALRSVASLQLAGGQIQPGPLHTLQLQLNPAELGAVTANLRFAGEQLSVEIAVENHEAYRRLSAETEVIASTLRGLGYTVDQVSVLQPVSAAASTSGARPDAGGGASTRDGQAAGSGEGGERMGGRGSSDERGGDGRNAHAGGQADRARRGIYI